MRAYRDWPPVRWAREHRALIDTLIAAAVAAGAVTIHLLQRSVSSHVYRDPTWWTVPLVVLACAPLVWRRSHPIAAAYAALGVQMVLDVLTINGPGWIPVAASVFCLGSHCSGRRRAQATIGIAIIVPVFLTTAFLAGDETLTIGAALGLVAFLVIAFLVGEVLRRRRDEITELAARAERAELERELLASQRVSEERTRIARDLHDVVAHSVSVMVIQATAARRNLERNPDAAAELLENIESTGRQTMGELRQILGVLRDTADELPPTAVLCDLDTLVRSVPELNVRYRTSGSLESVPAGVALSAYRVVQEALTNAHRHAGPNVVVEVSVDCTPERVNVSVADNGRGASAQVRTNHGYGLIGMGERVAAFGGSLRTGPRRSGGWEVRAHFPLTESTKTGRTQPRERAAT